MTLGKAAEASAWRTDASAPDTCVTDTYRFHCHWEAGGAAYRMSGDLRLMPERPEALKTCVIALHDGFATN